MGYGTATTPPPKSGNGGQRPSQSQSGGKQRGELRTKETHELKSNKPNSLNTCSSGGYMPASISDWKIENKKRNVILENDGIKISTRKYRRYPMPFFAYI